MILWWDNDGCTLYEFEILKGDHVDIYWFEAINVSENEIVNRPLRHYLSLEMPDNKYLFCRLPPMSHVQDKYFLWLVLFLSRT